MVFAQGSAKQKKTTWVYWVLHSIFFIRAMVQKKLGKKKKKPLKAKKVKHQGQKLGQAAALHGKAWNQWRQHVLHVGPSWLYAVVTLTHALCCRVSEILALQGRDFNFRYKTVRIKPLKRQPEVGF